MAPRSRATFAKRQKEQARQEKQRAKLQRRLDKKFQSQQSDQDAELDPKMSTGRTTAPSLPLAFDACTAGSNNPKLAEEQSCKKYLLEISPSTRLKPICANGLRLTAQWKAPLW